MEGSSVLGTSVADRGGISFSQKRVGYGTAAFMDLGGAGEVASDGDA
ncbi:MAG: hypothetical protein NT023_12330 [Armatimonadetes bacterium]|nr:hypothetical protein [Armatimonadota bacterium]